MKHLITISLLVMPLSSVGTFVPTKHTSSEWLNVGDRFLSHRGGDRHRAQADEYIKQARSYELNARLAQDFSRKRICVTRPVRILVNGNIFNTRKETELKISTGFTFDDGDQLLVSAQKPLGLVLEERGKDEVDLGPTTGVDHWRVQNSPNGCVVAEVLENSAAKRAGVKPGDFLVAVQNADVTLAHFEEVMQRIGDAPQVVNLRFWRKDWDDRGCNTE